MPSKKEWGILTDMIPPDYPYELVQLLKEAHEKLHLGKAKNDTITGESGIESLRYFFADFQPTSLTVARQKLERAIDITESNLGKEGNAKAMELIYKLFSEHTSSEKINHSY
ncbi:hypothetical protein A2130_00460 [Candidatus Woesebacteria bacterium GWC2_33_12]|uniref:Uncharacterized protein n=1 Tax=Candidatus Woesebacteria bacterium GW2011_GWB1_33_22 TaxID=1618566 RepID=A0A0F9ZYE6_9BACT|nr:MAG: hypothetical protein UR29_C0008G0041 [Candidatus Woesebacteria bacterium GW2011_GWC2_33_12]KKP41543.1 MAG: hypothetical protein UR33_C0013G0021 [Candidatus Woesebacteria bacterium GW2011_GWA2_33_20]KKP43996.1 MAG: hypothetical protein UR35_C0013G0021 [Candidatus Woesebacteria bacterium GW2011_GWB1_33_22]KKP46563.1 MAG: hypothetical protein UR37_C0006G0013 [Microgenomates group bacterium GW2011_GWC1_33_28]KKP49474.1 MAG: hypothetical protein UR41_C0014G0021 [Candidatus Woesebacteria bact